MDKEVWQSGLRDKGIQYKSFQLCSLTFIYLYFVFKVAAAPRGTPAPSINFLVKPEEKRKYDALFNQLKPTNGILPGDKVKQDYTPRCIVSWQITPIIHTFLGIKRIKNLPFDVLVPRWCLEQVHFVKNSKDYEQGFNLFLKKMFLCLQ